MSKIDLKIKIGNVNLRSLETEDDIHKEAKRLLPQALVEIGEATAETTWVELQKQMKKSGMKPNSSSSDKRKFIQEAGRNYQRSATSTHKREIENHIVEQIRKLKK
ncbi:hypothetical protein IQ247_13315 [Plectonema cf. radiosum LEGE 06105]|uniref:Uncharacterized protein n=1 Tax=Plectonema cf. radiosum LEGE 06105 TaxID=945769 RepID=A0A8J7F3Z2_9CYAN|nr:hypothetical protein [Plectonema radiosum]MBE9213633.1 hypothetical protein [Plectonema cf. radiosum LEGE 06105]